MRSTIVFAFFLACISLVYCGTIPKKFPETRDHGYLDTYFEYPLKRQDYVRYFQHNYNYPEPHDDHPYFGYPYGECSSCRSYQTEEVAVVKPDCPCKTHVDVSY